MPFEIQSIPPPITSGGIIDKTFLKGKTLLKSDLGELQLKAGTGITITSSEETKLTTISTP